MLAAIAVLLAVVAGATFSLKSQPANALTPTPSSTPTSTPEPGFSFSYSFKNTNSFYALGLDLLTGHYETINITSPDGCGSPTVTRTYVQTFLVQTALANLPLSIGQDRTELRWPTGCIDPNETVHVTFDLDSFFLNPAYFFGGMNGSSVATHQVPGNTFIASSLPTATATAVVTPGVVSMAIDCDIVTAGVQSTCNVPVNAGTAQIDLILLNNGPATTLGAFNFMVRTSDPSRLLPPTAPCPSPGFDCNPDLNQTALPNPGWACGP
jgi:hypothetical protein